MPQIQTIEGLHGLGQASTENQTFLMAAQVSKDAYIAAVERILKAAAESPDHVVAAPEFPRVTGGSSPCSLRGQTLTCRMRRQKISEIVTAIQEGPDPEYFNPTHLRQIDASRFNEDRQVKALFPIIASIEQQLPMSNMTWFAIGFGTVAVLGLGWYLMKRKSPRRVSLRGLAGTPSEHAAKAREHVWTARMMEAGDNYVGAFEQYSKAIAECSWTGSEWPRDCVEAHDNLDALKLLFSDWRAVRRAEEQRRGQLPPPRRTQGKNSR